MALREFEIIASEARERFGDVRMAIVHRVGEVRVGEISVAVLASAAHRGAAFDACRYAIDEVKSRAPIWKRERYADGSARMEHEPVAKVELFRISAERNPVAVLWYEPRRPRGVCVIAGHGYSSSKQNLDFLCSFLASHGFGVYNLDFPGHKLGSSGGELRGVDDCIDAMTAVVAVRTRARRRAAYTLGHSMGGMTAIFTAALEPGVLGTIAIATGYGRPTSLETLRRVGVADFRSSYVVGVTLAGARCRRRPALWRAARAARRAARHSTSPRITTRWSARERARALRSRAGAEIVRDDRERPHLCRGKRARDRVRVAERAPSRARRYDERERARASTIQPPPSDSRGRLTRPRAACAARAALVVGAGGLGSPALQYLAAAGVGRIGVVDDDEVDETNLQRQTIFSQADVGRKKASLPRNGSKRSIRWSTSTRFRFVSMRRTLASSCALYDVVLDCTDRFRSRYLINDACFFEKRPDVYGSIFRFDGQVSVFRAPGGPCYRCLYPEPPPVESRPTCAEGGVLGALAGIVGAWQASEALKLLLGIGEPLAGRLLLIDALDARVREVRFDARSRVRALRRSRRRSSRLCRKHMKTRCRDFLVSEIEAEQLDDGVARRAPLGRPRAARGGARND